MFQNAIRAGSESCCESVHGARILPSAPTFDSETGVQVSGQDKNVCSESSENFIYLMQNLRIGNNDCLTFFNSGANAHLIVGTIGGAREVTANILQCHSFGSDWRWSSHDGVW